MTRTEEIENILKERIDNSPNPFDHVFGTRDKQRLFEFAADAETLDMETYEKLKYELMTANNDALIKFARGEWTAHDIIYLPF